MRSASVPAHELQSSAALPPRTTSRQAYAALKVERRTLGRRQAQSPQPVHHRALWLSATGPAIASGVSLIGDGVNGLAEGLAGLAGLEAETTKNARSSPWRGTHLDAFVYAAHALLTETSRATSNAVANPLLVSVRNLAPFAGKNALSRGSCERLCRLVERYASHALLFAREENGVSSVVSDEHSLQEYST